jgi:hypothetical protein
MRIGLWDYVFGGPAEVDVASIDDVQPMKLDDLFIPEAGEGLQNYEMGGVGVAAIL